VSEGRGRQAEVSAAYATLDPNPFGTRDPWLFTYLLGLKRFIREMKIAIRSFVSALIDVSFLPSAF